ncbi:MAG: Lrp/AsnC ligand binding domain-containing protein [Candidatus Hydrothermarchaeaceae archaeon]
MELDDLDVKILTLLQKDARASYKEMAGKLGVSTPTIRNRINSLTNLGVIRRFTTIISDELIGGVTSIVLIDADSSMLEEISKEISDFPEVREVYRTAGDFELVAKLFLDDMDALEEFLTKKLGKVDGIRKIRNYLVIKGAKEEDKVLIKTKKRIILKCEFCVCEIPHEPHTIKVDDKEHYFCCAHCAKAYKTGLEIAHES